MKHTQIIIIILLLFSFTVNAQEKDSSFNKVQDQSISQIDMYPTVLDYIGYNKPFYGNYSRHAFRTYHQG